MKRRRLLRSIFLIPQESLDRLENFVAGRMDDATLHLHAYKRAGSRRGGMGLSFQRLHGSLHFITHNLTLGLGLSAVLRGVCRGGDDDMAQIQNDVMISDG